jgi:ABC-2 type transport system ATP-binding protein
MADGAVLATHGLTKDFGRIHALADLDLEAREGEILGFLGPNGAGKTTTIRLLMDFIRPTRGRATVLGGEPRDPAIRTRVGYLPAELHIDPRYTTDDVVDFFGRLRGGVDRRHVDELLERFDLDPTRPAGELSTGNRRKIGIVQTFMHRPKLLLLDEPTSGLDPLLQHEFTQLLRQAVDAGATVFLSSHVLPEVELLAQRVAIMRRGRLVAFDGIDALRSRARQRLDLHLADTPDPQRFTGLPGVDEVEVVGTTIQLVVEGSVDPVIKAAAHEQVLRIVTHDTDLEDVFLAYYQDSRP